MRSGLKPKICSRVGEVGVVRSMPKYVLNAYICSMEGVLAKKCRDGGAAGARLAQCGREIGAAELPQERAKRDRQMKSIAKMRPSALKANGSWFRDG